jgi:hypothetical protein
MRVPDDVILLWTDENWGNIRRLPTSSERNRTGGAGIYYHFGRYISLFLYDSHQALDFVGGPRDYKWGSTHAISKYHHQLEMAKKYGADKLWIVNVGLCC